MKSIAIFAISLILYFPINLKITQYLQNKPVIEKIGYLPKKEFLKAVSLEHKSLVSELLFLKAIIYFGERIVPNKSKSKKEIDYYGIYRLIDISTYIDPYNIDSYYFVQAAFTWEIGRIKETNYILERGLKYRTWDFYIPFFLGFNYFYFLKDYKTASVHMNNAAKLAKDPLFISLASRFMYESEETEQAISFLKVMIEETFNQSVKIILKKRLVALERISYLEQGVKKYEKKYNKKPKNIYDLVTLGIIKEIPDDPYGGNFFIDDSGKIRSTSKLTEKVKSGNSN